MQENTSGIAELLSTWLASNEKSEISTEPLVPTMIPTTVMLDLPSMKADRYMILDGF